MAEYIEREALEHHFMTKRRYLDKNLVLDAAYEINKFPSANVIAKGAYDQVCWERDVAMKQLEDCGIPFGGKSDVAPVVHGRWEDGCWCSVCGKFSVNAYIKEYANFCPNCGAKMNVDK